VVILQVLYNTIQLQNRGQNIMALIYSYIRFSSKKQEQNDSVRRQVALGKAWIDAHPEHVLDEQLLLRDLGVSAFRGANLDSEKGALGAFIELAKKPNSPIPKGSILMIERLDRFSRQQTSKAYRVFCELIDAGVKVLVLEPTQLIDESNINSMDTVIPLIVGLQIAYEQSREKRKRVGHAWKTKREQAEQGKPMSKRCPSWLVWDDENNCFAINKEAKKALDYIFKRTAEGCGQRQLTSELNSKFPPVGRSGKWNGSYVQKVLSDRAVLGELQPHLFDDSGVRAPIGSPIKDYYPRIISDDLFDRSAQAKFIRRRAKGPNSKFINLFVGLVYGSDGHKMHVQTGRARRKNNQIYTQRRLVSYGHTRGLQGSCNYSLDYYKFERLVLNALKEIESGALIDGINDTEDMHKYDQRYQGIEMQIQQQKEWLLTNGKTQSAISTIMQAIEELEKKRDALKPLLSETRQAKAKSEKTLMVGLRDLLKTITEQPDNVRQSIRHKLRAMIATVIEKIEVEAYKDGHFVLARGTIHTMKGHVRRFSIKKTGLVLSEKQMAHEVEGGDILLMKTKDGVIEFKPGESLSEKLLDVSYAIDPKDEAALLKKGKKPRDLSGRPLAFAPKPGAKKKKKP
jgi:DNA invertase Pin-like site-specific DNA recombinase